LISVTGLELAFVVAPPSMKGFITAMWLTTVGIANLFINAPVGRLYATMDPAHYFGMLTAMMAVIIVVFFFVGNWFNQKMAAKHSPAPETEQETAIKAAATTAEA
jgi:dipeptide/tripeptide permease